MVQDLEPADWSIVPDILKILDSDFPRSLISRRYLEFYSSCKEDGEKNLDPILLTPGGQVDSHGTFVICVPRYHYSIFYTLDPDWRRMKSLLESKNIPWDKKPIWGPIHQSLQPALDELYKEQNIIEADFPVLVGDAFIIDVEQAKKITYEFPPEVYLASLKEEEAKYIDSYWSQRGGNSAEVTKIMIKKNGGFGLYLKHSDHLIAWCIIWTQNGPGQLCVSAQHRRKGYGTLLAKVVTKSLAEKGIQSLCFSQKGNTAGQELLTKLGYEKCYEVTLSSGKYLRDQEN